MEGRCFAGCNKLQLKHCSSLADTRVAAPGTEDLTLITAAAFQSLADCDCRPPPRPPAAAAPAFYNTSDMLLALVHGLTPK